MKELFERKIAMPSKKKTYKRLTNAEKKMNKLVRKELIEAGVIRVKPRLNRKKFCDEAEKEFIENFKSYDDIQYLMHAISYMLPVYGNVKLEEVGVCKVLKIAVALKKFDEEQKEKGETKNKGHEIYEKVVKPIREA